MEQCESVASVRNGRAGFGSMSVLTRIIFSESPERVAVEISAALIKSKDTYR